MPADRKEVETTNRKELCWLQPLLPDNPKIQSSRPVCWPFLHASPADTWPTSAKKMLPTSHHVLPSPFHMVTLLPTGSTTEDCMEHGEMRDTGGEGDWGGAPSGSVLMLTKLAKLAGDSTMKTLRRGSPGGWQFPHDSGWPKSQEGRDQQKKL